MIADPPPRPERDLQEEVTLPDRRRPGRIATDNPHLIALMRGAGRGGLSRPGEGEEWAGAEADDLAPARGIGLAVGIGLLMWLLIAAIAILV